jgi:O-antigen/teichoic acid export membrane protein
MAGAPDPAPAPAGPAAVGSRRAAIDVAVQLVGRLANLALGIVVTALVVRTLGQRGYGQWSTIFAVTELIGYVGSLGLEQVATRRAAAEPEVEASWVGALVTLRTAIGLPVALLSVAIIGAISRSEAMFVGGILASAIMLYSGPASLRVILQLRVRNDLQVVFMTVNSVLWGAAVIVLATADAGIVPFAAAFLVASALSVAVLTVLALRLGRPRLRGSRALWPELIRVGVPIGVAGMLTLAYAKIDQLLVFELAGSREAGFYGAAVRILDSAVFVPAAVMTTLFPIISAAAPVDRERVRRLVQIAVDYLGIASLGALAFVLVAARPVVGFLFGADFLRVAPALEILMGAYVVISFGYVVGNLVIVLGLQRILIPYAILGLVVNVALNAVLIPAYGFVAAAWVTLVTEILVNGLVARAVLRTLEMHVGVGRLARAAVAVGAMAAGVWALREAGLGVVGLAAVAAVVYPVLLFAVRALRPSEIGEFLRRRPA